MYFTKGSQKIRNYLKRAHIMYDTLTLTLRTGDIEDSDVENTALRTCDFEDTTLKTCFEDMRL